MRYQAKGRRAPLAPYPNVSVENANAAMGFFKAALDLVSEVATLGGASRLDAARRQYEEAFGRLQLRVDIANRHKSHINAAVEDIGRLMTNAKPHLQAAERLLKSRSVTSLDLNVDISRQTLQRVEKCHAGMNTAISVGVGSVAGGTMAVGAWSLVALFGSASTGTAIAGLSGVAATNATLAWFGGGALAAGGAGIAGGMTVLGGIVAIPLVYVAARSTHKRAKELEDVMPRIEQEIVEMDSQVDTLASMVRVVESRLRHTDRMCRETVSRIMALKKVIRPFGPLSAIKQMALATLGRQPYSKVQLDAIAQLTEVVATFLAKFDVEATEMLRVNQVGAQ